MTSSSSPVGGVITEMTAIISSPELPVLPFIRIKFPDHLKKSPNEVREMITSPAMARMMTSVTPLAVRSCSHNTLFLILSLFLFKESTKNRLIWLATQ